MPNSGQLLEPTLTTAEYGWDWLVFKLGSVATVSSSDPAAAYSHGGTARTDYVEDALLRLLGIYLSVESSWDGAAGSWSAEYDGPGGPLTYGAASYLSDVSIEVRMPDVLLYSRLTGSLLQLETGPWQIWVNGVLQTTFGAGYSDVSEGVGPHYISQIGIPLAVSGSCSIEAVTFPTDPIDEEGNVVEGGVPATFTYDPCDPTITAIDESGEIEATLYGGWRFQPTGSVSWVELPIITNVPATTGSGPFGLDATGVILATDTWGNLVASRSYWRYEFEYIGRENPTETFVQVTCDGVVVRTDTNASSGNSCTDPCTGLPGPYFRDLYRVAYAQESQFGSIRLIPDLEAAIERFGTSGHSAECYRYPFPQTKKSWVNSWVESGGSGSSSSITEVHPSLSEFKGLVEQSPGSFEEPFDYEPYCEVFVQKAQAFREGFTSYGPEICVCPWDWFVLGSSPCVFPALIGYLCGAEWPTTDTPTVESETVQFQFPSYVEDGSIGGVLIGGPMYHADDLTRYFSAWCHPLWLMYYWTSKWSVDYAQAHWRDYWGPVREQFQEDAFASQGYGRRNFCIATFMQDENGHTPFLDEYTAPPSSDPEDPNDGLRWIGVSRWKTAGYTLPTSKTLSTSEPCEWAARVQSGTPDCTVTLGAGGIVLSAFNVATARVDCNLLNWDTAPFLLLAMAQIYTVGWSPTNVSAISVVLVGWDDSETPLTTVPGSIDIASLTSVQSKYAGTWAIENGAGAVSDLGADLLSGGISSSTMTDYPSRAMAFQLGLGRNWKALRFYVTPTNPANPVTLDWPEFEFPVDEPKLVWETGKDACMVWADGPGIRWGAITAYVPGFGFFDPPLTSGLGTANTIIDAKVFGHRLIEGTGGASIETTITGELGDIVDSLEGPASISVVDKFSLAFMLPMDEVGAWDRAFRIALCNSFAEVPPLCCFPVRKRGTDDWLADGSYWAGVYDWAQLPRAVICAGDEVPVIENSSGVAQSSPLAGLPAGWVGCSYSPLINNTEMNWRVRVGARRLASVRPWHGWYLLPGDAGGRAATWMSYDVSDSRRHVLAWANASNAVSLSCSANLPSLEFADNLIGVTATAGCARWVTGRELVLWTVESGTVYQRTSPDEGGTVSVATSIGSGTQVTGVVTPQRVRYIYRRTSAGAVVVQARDSEDNVLKSDTTVVASGVDNAAIDCEYRPLGSGLFEIVLWTIEGGTLMERYSNDGIVFS